MGCQVSILSMASILPCPILSHLSHPFSSCLILEFRAKAAFEVHPLVIKNALPSSVGDHKKKYIGQNWVPSK